MADRSLSIRLALTDGGKVKAELADIGASGQKVLERIRDAAQPASRGLRALDAASHAVRGKIQEMAGSAGVLGEALQKIGPYGLAAAAGIGAFTRGARAGDRPAREAIETFDALDDQAARITGRASLTRMVASGRASRHAIAAHSVLKLIAFGGRCVRAVVEDLRVGALIRATPTIAATRPAATEGLIVSPSNSSPRTTPTPARR